MKNLENKFKRLAGSTNGNSLLNLMVNGIETIAIQARRKMCYLLALGPYRIEQVVVVLEPNEAGLVLQISVTCTT